MRFSLAFATLIFAAGANAASHLEQQVLDAIKAPQVTVVHLWAPWCGNCKSELKSGGWSEMVKKNPHAKFLFVSVWNSGGDGRDLLQQHGVADQPNVIVLADPGPRRGDDKLKRFLDLPVSWIPSTWVYKDGELRYAMNYGEVRFPALQQFLDDSIAEW